MQEQQIKAVPTRYKGYHFRSRLEARWAVFFDALGIEWEYEPEGFDLGEHGWYLPDFYLPFLNVYVEIKPDKYQNYKVESDFSKDLEFQMIIKKCGDFLLKTNKTIALCFGNPDGNGFLFSYACRCVDGTDDGEKFLIDKLIPVANDFKFVAWYDYKLFDDRIKTYSSEYILDNPDGIMFFVTPTKFVRDNKLQICEILNSDNCKELVFVYSVSEKHSIIVDCLMAPFINAFKSARFEHGESGAT